jgi:hypothetical protein
LTDQSELGAQPGLKVVNDQPARVLAHSPAFAGVETTDFLFDGIVPRNALEHFAGDRRETGRGELVKAELCRREGIAESMYYSWSKAFLEAGKRRLAGDTARAATTDEVKGMTGSGLVGVKRSKTSRRSRIGFGTAYPTTSGSALSRRRLSSRS